MLRGDFHIHTRFSRDSATSPQRLVARCLKVGLNCIAVTDHNTIRGAQEVAKLAPFRVIIGSEVKSAAGEITGLFLKEEVPGGLSPLETVERIKAQGGLVSIPHPFDGIRRSVIRREALEEVLPRADIVEAFNARNTFKRANEMALRAAQEHGLLVTAVSDAHHVLELGRTYTEMPEFDGTPQGFKEALRQARLVGHPASPLVHSITTWNKLVSRVRRWF
ncbi:MAG: PHP domain-containing protein [Chloroflexi bacterium]|nr:PHP domain-containing protein [Chloroflexota bacterium]